MPIRSHESSNSEQSRPEPRSQSTVAEVRLAAVVQAAYILEARTR